MAAIVEQPSLTPNEANISSPTLNRKQRRQHQRKLKRQNKPLPNQNGAVQQKSPDESQWKALKRSALRDQQEDKHAPTRDLINQIAEHADEWAGIPYPLEGVQLVVEPKCRAAKFLNNLNKLDDPEDTESLINSWYCHTRQMEVLLWREADGSLHHGFAPAIHHLAQDIDTIGCTQAWSLASEITAMETLRGLLTEHLFKMYFLTGMFLETSKRSNITYIFRRLRPTVACSATPRMVFNKSRDTSMRILACLCSHPIGFYRNTWAGVMTPTDDVLAALLLMRGDEHMFWKRANQIPPWQPEAGL